MNSKMMMMTAAAFAAIGAGAATISDVAASQGYPWNGKVDISYTISGDIASEAAAKGKTVALAVQALDRETGTKYVADEAALSGETNLLAGTHAIVWDFNVQGIAMASSNVVFAVLAKVTGSTTTPDDPSLGGVQLWEGGPYWAECNVGASSPEEYGYYFWWGDTVGYKREGGTLTGDYDYSGVTWVSSTGETMGSSPFDKDSCPTYGLSTNELWAAGYIGTNGNLTAAYDAATTHLESPWRMPTDAEFSALISNCDTVWTNCNGVAGQLVTGKGDYSSRSIFLPAAGYGDGSGLSYPGSRGFYWSSTPYSSYSVQAWRLNFNSSNFSRAGNNRYFGQSVRAVRECAK